MNKSDIIRNASLLLGKSQVNQTSTGGTEGNALADIYERLLPALLEADDWRFSTATKQLNKLEHTSNVPGFNKVFALPAQYLRLNYLIPNVDYDIQENYIYCNADSLKANFRFLVDESKFSASFTDFFIHKIALSAAIMPAFGLKKEYVQMLDKETDLKYRKALASNGQSVPPKEIVDSPLIRAGYW